MTLIPTKFRVRLICGTAKPAELVEPAEPREMTFYYNYSTQLLLIWIITSTNYDNSENYKLQSNKSSLMHLW